MRSLEFILVLFLNWLSQNVSAKVELPQEVPLENISNSSINLKDFPGELCNRECISNDQRICYFSFVLEHYQAMGVACQNCLNGDERDCDLPQCIVGDGFEKGVMSINRQIPGPAIQVCHNDHIVVDVENMAAGTAASLHWHGMHMRATPWMDGVPFVTQCPISFSNTFRYQFKATQAGTHFYHSHSGHHKMNGQYGSLIVRPAIKQDAHAENYDFDLPEHYILISDYMHKYAENMFPGVPHSDGIYPDSMLINGRGSYRDRKTHERQTVPPTRYYVTQGNRYRFRLIDSVSHACPVQFQIEGHRMNVIASDSFDVSPHPFDTLIINSGERFDFVLEANQSAGDYWMRVRGLPPCTSTDSVALLRYRSVEGNEANATEAPLPEIPAYNDRYPMGETLNNPNSLCYNGENDYCITDLNALESDDELRFAKPDFQFYLGFNNYPVDNKVIFRQGHYPHFVNLGGNNTVIGAISNLSLIMPDTPPLTQPEDIDESIFCDENNVPKKCDGTQICQCVHRIKVALGSVVELVVVDESSRVGIMHHPFHLHGVRFMVTGLGQHPYEPMTVKMARKMDMRRSLLRSSFGNPPWKDTVTIPSFGYGIFRFRANNPGYWLLHCHFEWHLSIGMGLVVQVGENSEMVPAPSGFPKCGNYKPNLMEL